MIYVLLVIVVLALGFIWFQQQANRKRLIALGVGILMLGLVFLSDTLVESSREEAVRKIQELADASQARDLDAMFHHISEDFRYKNRVTKAEFRGIAESVMTSGLWSGAAVWDFDRAYASEEGERVIIGFRVKDVEREIQFYCEATFQRDADGELRMVSFLCYDPIDQRSPETLPMLG